MTKLAGYLILACIFLVNSAVASNLRCKGELIENRGISSTKLLQKAETAFLGKVSSYTFEKGHPIFSGFYTVNVQAEIKGVELGQYKIWGDKPFDVLPQHYLDLTISHNSMNFDSLYGGTTGIIETKQTCILKPKFLIGYNYLILLGVKSELAFEPINSPQIDLFYKTILSAN